MNTAILVTLIIYGTVLGIFIISFIVGTIEAKNARKRFEDFEKQVDHFFDKF